MPSPTDAAARGCAEIFLKRCARPSDHHTPAAHSNPTPTQPSHCITDEDHAIRSHDSILDINDDDEVAVVAAVCGKTLTDRSAKFSCPRNAGIDVSNVNFIYQMRTRELIGR